METPTALSGVRSPTKVQFLYKHLNGRYYVRTYAGGKEKWISLKTTVMSVAKNRMKEHLEAATRQQSSGEKQQTTERFSFGDGISVYRKELAALPLRPNTKAYRESGLKLVLRSWKGIEELVVRRITSKMVEEWLGKFKAEATPYVPNGAKKASKVSTGASVTTLKCALDAVRQVLDVAVNAGQLAANPARNATVTTFTGKLFKAARREKAERGGLLLPSRSDFMKVVATVRHSAVADCVAAAEFIQFIAFCGARRNEAINVCWEDVDFAGERIHLRVTKNGEARWVPMVGEMRQLLEEMSQNRKFSGSEEKVLRVKEAQGFITSACAKVGVRRFTTHSLRHLFGTTCLEAGVDAPMTAAWLGHKDNGALLLKVYSHIRNEHESAMIKKVRFS